MSPAQQTVAKLIDEPPTSAPTFTRRPQPTSMPPATQAAPAVAPQGVITYTVVSGDTMSGIASQFGLSTDELVAANQDSLSRPDQLHIGQQIRVPVAGDQVAAAAPPPGEPAPAPGEGVPDAPAGEAAPALSMDPVLSSKLGVPAEAPDEAPADAVRASNGGTAAPDTILPAKRSDEANLELERERSVAAALPAPWPVAPAEGARITGEGPVLVWSSVGVLPDGTHYVVEIRPADLAPEEPSRLVWVVSNATAVRVPGDMRPPLGTARQFEWTVSARRRTGRVLGADRGELLGAPSEVRAFEWAP
jgi:LysM repeat protein